MLELQSAFLDVVLGDTLGVNVNTYIYYFKAIYRKKATYHPRNLTFVCRGRDDSSWMKNSRVGRGPFIVPLYLFRQNIPNILLTSLDFDDELDYLFI